MDPTTLSVYSKKVKDFLTNKLEQSNKTIQKMKRKRRIIKTLYYTTTILSIIMSAILATTTATIGLPPIAITILGMCSGILTTISIKFNFKDKNHQITKEIEHLNSLKNSRLWLILLT